MNRRSFLSLVVAVAFSLAGTAAFAESPKAVTLDQSTPKAAAKSMMQAMHDGDAEGVKNSFDRSSEKMASVLDALAPMMAASGRLMAVTSEKFEQPVGIGGMSVDLKLMMKAIDAGTVEEQGDQATVVPDTSMLPDEYKQSVEQAGMTVEEASTVKLNKVDGKWLVQPESMQIDEATADSMLAKLEMVTAQMSAMAEAMNSVTAKVEQGEIADAAAAEQALEQAMMTAMMKMQQQMGQE